MTDPRKEINRRMLEVFIESLQDNPDQLLTIKNLLGLNTVAFPNEIFIRINEKRDSCNCSHVMSSHSGGDPYCLLCGYTRKEK